MARTVSTSPVKISSKTTNPYAQPCFSVYCNEHSVYGGGWTLFDHNLECIGKYSGDGSYAYNQFRTYTSYAPEMFQNYAGNAYFETTSYPSTSSEYGSNTCNVGYLGHQNFFSVTEFSKNAGYVHGDNGRQYKGAAFRDNGCIAGEQNQDYAIFGTHNGGSGTLFHVGPRSACKFYMQQHQRGNRFDISPKSTSGQGMYGAIGYNPRIKRMVVLESDGSYKHTPVVYENCPDLRMWALNENQFANTTDAYNAYSVNDSKLRQHFENSSNYTVWTQTTDGLNNWSGHAESNWRGIPIVCDNGIVYSFHMMPHHGACLQKWNADGSYAGQQWNASWTTSYGYEQGNRFGARWQTSSDGEYVWAYCPSYHYGSGIYWVCIRVRDGKWLYFQTNDGSHSRQLCPVGRSNMFYGTSDNGDNPGLYYRMINLNHHFETRQNGTELSNFDSSRGAYLLDCAGNSTKYPCVIPAMYNTSLFNNQLPENWK